MADCVSPCSRFRSGALKSHIMSQVVADVNTKSDKKPQVTLTPLSDSKTKLDRKRSAILLDNYRSHNAVT